MKLALIGGAGYVGSRLRERLVVDHTVDIIDLGLLLTDESPPNLLGPHGPQDVLTMDPAVSRQYDCVVWLATIHDVPPEQEASWLEVTRKLMVTTPMQWARRSQQFVYFSSMRAQSAPRSLYGMRKRQFETHAPEHAVILRPGTIWGGYRQDLPNRLHTAINRQMLQGGQVFVPDFHAHMDLVLDVCMRQIASPQPGIHPIIDPYKWHRPELGVHPMVAYRRYYHGPESLSDVR